MEERDRRDTGDEPAHGAMHRVKTFLILALCRAARHGAGMAGRVRRAIPGPCSNFTQ